MLTSLVWAKYLRNENNNKFSHWLGVVWPEKSLHSCILLFTFLHSFVYFLLYIFMIFQGQVQEIPISLLMSKGMRKWGWDIESKGRPPLCKCRAWFFVKNKLHEWEKLQGLPCASGQLGVKWHWKVHVEANMSMYSMEFHNLPSFTTNISSIYALVSEHRWVVHFADTRM